MISNLHSKRHAGGTRTPHGWVRGGPRSGIWFGPLRGRATSEAHGVINETGNPWNHVVSLPFGRAM